jgi:4-amino-4-deoxy-L-arabinose transferase-like glycosyltransferase
MMIGATVLLGWLIAHTEVLFTDGLRFIAQARTIDQGAWNKGIVKSVDHPVYPLAIVAAHRLIGGNDAYHWQTAAQLAAAAAGVLLVIPIYLIALELFGSGRAWIATLFIYLVPFNGHLLADALSESTLLLFWSFGVWSSLRLLRTGRLAWLLPVVAASVLAYLTRPEGLVVAVALVGTLIVLPLWPANGLPRVTVARALGWLMVGGLLAAGPFMLLKGGISSKPSVSRLLGFAPRADAMAVERERPLDPAQSGVKTALLATRALARAVTTATTLPLLLLAPAGIALSCAGATERRLWLFLAIMLGLCALALIRVHAMAGYCTPRHAVTVAWVLILAGGAATEWVATSLGRVMERFLGGWSTMGRVGVASKAIVFLTCLAAWGPAMTAPIDSGFSGYRQAGEWLATFATAGERVIDPKGLSIFYAHQQGYTFATLVNGSRDRAVRWVVLHDALLHGPWDYCTLLRALVGDRPATRVFPVNRVPGTAQVYVFDLSQPRDRTAESSFMESRPRR